MREDDGLDIVELMRGDDRCPSCGALLNGQPACGHCGLEPEPEAPTAQVIWLGPRLGAGSRVPPAWADEPQVA